MTYKLRYRETFWKDYVNTLNYLKNTLKNPIAARELDEALEREKQSVRTFPKAVGPYAAPPEVDAPYDAIRVKNYMAFYVVVGDTVEFRRFLYSRANWKERWKDR